MKRTTGLAVACLTGGLMATAVASGLLAHARGVAGAWSSSVQPGLSPVITRQVVINEVAWMGTGANPSDEWIELHNTGDITIPLDGWQVLDDDHLSIPLSGELAPRGYYLIERTDDDAVSDIPADWFGSFGSGGLSNAGEVLTLTDGLGNTIDTANAHGGEWPAGAASDGSPSYASMERIDPTAPDIDDNWCTNEGMARNGEDANGDPINGTPRAQNSCYCPPAVPSADLVVAKSGPAAVKPGVSITYRVALSNTGTTTATHTVLTDTLPAAVDFITQTSPFTFMPLGRTLVWQVGDVPAGKVYLITATGRVSNTVRNTLVNVVTAATATSETFIANNSAGFSTTLEAVGTVHLPLLARNYTPPRYGVIIEAVLYDGQQYVDYDEAVLLVNGGDGSVDLGGWALCKWGSVDWRCADLPEVEIASRQRLWLARSGIYFAKSFGFDPDYVLSGWPRFANQGDEVVLQNADGTVWDALVYENGLTDVEGWDGPAVQPYKGSSLAEPGQVLYRFLEEETSLPARDTDTAADWAQHAGDAWYGRRVRYPGWDLEWFYQPALGTSGALTAGIAPDNAYQLVANTIRSAEESIELEAYTLEHYQFVTELAQQAQQGVTVTVLLEGEPAGGIEDQELWACQQLHATGHGTCTFMFNDEAFDIYDRYTLLHAKFIVVDRKRLLLGSQNLTHTSLAGDDKANGTGGSRGVVLVTDAPEMVARAVEVFQADCDPANHADVTTWAPDNAFGYGLPSPGFTPDSGEDWVTYTVQFPNPVTVPGTGFELVTAPEAALRGSDGLLGLVARAGTGDAVYVEQLYEHREWGANPTVDPNLRLETYIAAARRGAKVRILLNGGDFGIEGFSLSKNIEAAAYVNEIARTERLDLSAHLGDPTEYGIHNKMVLVDLGIEGKYTHVGSINGSETSNKINREMALQVRSAALFNYLYAVFDYDWNHQPPERHLLVSEVMYNPDGNDPGREWVEIYNPTTENVDLSGWYLGDVGPAGEYGSGLYRFPNGAISVAEGVIVVAHQANDVAFTPDYEFLIDPNRDDPAVRNMSPAGSWDGFGLALGNGGDEVLLLDGSGAAVDVMAYGGGDYSGVIPHPGVSDQGRSLERRPPRADTDDCSQDFLERYPTTPGTLPSP
ncbi:MAG: lamin tail domain-containing protein [Anaerolineae bacterium]|jgi:uncharacterized repeat protein (TIGR01451 family)